MKRPALVLVAAPAAAVLATGAYLAWPRGASPVTQQEALAHFRAQPTTPPPPPPPLQGLDARKRLLNSLHAQQWFREGGILRRRRSAS